MARLAHAMAIENTFITADVIEIEEFPTLAQTFAVRGVPKTVLTTSLQHFSISPPVQFVGAVPEAEFVEKVLEVGVKPTSDQSNPGLNEPAGPKLV